MTKHLLRDLEELGESLMRMSIATENALAKALDAILTRNVEEAKEVVVGDAEIDRMEVALEEEALKILALHVPVASDLRFVIAAIKINNDLERIADVAANVAKRAVDLAKKPPVPAPEGFDEMAQRARTMLREAIRSLVKRDQALAGKVLAEDDEVDALERRILQALEDRMQEAPDEIPALLRWVSAVRAVERIADGATNVAEDVIYLEEGEIVRHQGGDWTRE